MGNQKKFLWDGDDIVITEDPGAIGPSAYIAEKTKDFVVVAFGGQIGSVAWDGEEKVRKGEAFYDWTFEQLQATDETSIIYDEGV